MQTTAAVGDDQLPCSCLRPETASDWRLVALSSGSGAGVCGVQMSSRSKLGRTQQAMSNPLQCVHEPLATPCPSLGWLSVSRPVRRHDAVRRASAHRLAQRANICRAYLSSVPRLVQRLEAMLGARAIHAHLQIHPHKLWVRVHPGERRGHIVGEVSDAVRKVAAMEYEAVAR